MQIVIDILEEQIPKKQDIIDLQLHFIDGHVVEASGYGFEERKEGKWITDDLPEEHDMYLVTWTSKTSGDYRWLDLLEFFPEDEDGNEGEGWATHDIEKMGYKDIEVIAWKPVEPYDPEKGV